MNCLDRAVQIASSFEEMEDTRPEWLKQLPHANDPEATYFRALYEWSRLLQPKTIMEIGTDRGWSAASMAAGAPSSTVVTIDIRASSAEFVRALPIKNIIPLTMNSSVAARHVTNYSPFDVLFVDGNHTFNQTYGEYAAYRPLVREGGLILFDDLALDMAGDEMGVFWAHVLDSKRRLDHLHHTGFGICQVHHAIEIPAHSKVIEAATRRILG